MWLPSNLVRRYLGWCVIFSLLHLTYHRCVFNNTVLLVCSDAIRCWVGCAVCLTWWISLSSCCSLFATLPKNQLFSDSISHVIVRLGFHCFFFPWVVLEIFNVATTTLRGEWTQPRCSFAPPCRQHLHFHRIDRFSSCYKSYTAYLSSNREQFS